AEDGIRDFHVTGVQTCALPISGRFRPLVPCGLLLLVRGSGVPALESSALKSAPRRRDVQIERGEVESTRLNPVGRGFIPDGVTQIGRASRRERVAWLQAACPAP